jgi:hypothetical protein
MQTSKRNQVIVLALVALAVLGDVAIFVFRSLLPWYDGILHGYATFAYTLLFGLFAYGAVFGGAREHRLLLVLAIGSVGLALGELWEIAEWAYDQVRPNVILGKFDTIVDLIMDTLGALAAALVCLKMLKK